MSCFLILRSFHASGIVRTFPDTTKLDKGDVNGDLGFVTVLCAGQRRAPIRQELVTRPEGATQISAELLGEPHWGKTGIRCAAIVSPAELRSSSEMLRVAQSIVSSPKLASK